MQLHPDLSFCCIGDEFVFLNLAQDRYFTIGRDLAEAFKAALDGTADESDVRRLKERGIIVAGGNCSIAACPAELPKRSLLDQSQMPPSAKQVLSLAWAFTRTRSRLRRVGLAGPATTLAAMRQSTARANDDAGLAASVGAYDRLCLLKGAHDLCLPHSLALATMLARLGYEAEVVLAVQLRPFAAHCWVECHGDLVNDRFDRVRSYTPIRRL